MTNYTYRVTGMDCADCALKVEKGVCGLSGVEAARVDFTTGLLEVQGEAREDVIRQRVEALGYGLEEKSRKGKEAGGSVITGFLKFLLSRRETRLALVGGALLLVSLVLRLAGIPEFVVSGLQILALIIAGYPIAREALVTLWINHDFNINLLMTIAAIGAVVIGDITESATLIFLFAISEALEGYTADKARRTLDQLNDLAPSQAIRLSTGKETIVPVEELHIGDTILVRAGERIPMDGMIQSGSSEINQATITGESLPVEKAPGDTVFAGTINGSGTLTVQVTRLVADTTIQRIIHMIEQAQAVRAPTQRFIDRFAQVYTPAMVLLAVLVAALPPLFFGQPFFNPPGGTGWLYRGLALLVIGCPCALVISAPVTIVSAITAAARHGVLIKGGAYLEKLAGIQVFAFDKTGTLTLGQPVVTDFHAVDCAGTSECSACEDVLALASALERRSPHPLARSVVEAAEARGLNDRYPPANDVVTLVGHGLRGQLNGKLATVGSHKLFDQEHPHGQNLCSLIQDAEARGQTTMLVCDGDRVRGFISVADALRPDSNEVIKAIRAMGYRTAVLTGDNAEVANAVGGTLGIDYVRANLLPDEKVSAIQELAQQHGRVAMVGDGINDAPALTSADLGIAMGGAASGQAMETADVVLMGGDLSKLPFSVRLSRFARRLIRQNVVISLGTKLLFVLLAMGGVATLWMAVLADVGVSLAVSLNGMRANRFNP